MSNGRDSRVSATTNNLGVQLPHALASNIELHSGTNEPHSTPTLCLGL